MAYDNEDGDHDEPGADAEFVETRSTTTKYRRKTSFSSTRSNSANSA